MDDSNWNILLVEDDKDDYFLVKTWLSQVKTGHFNLKWANTYEAGMQLVVAEPFDAVLVDYKLGSKTGLELIHDAITNCQHVPFIMLTGSGNYDLDLSAMKVGAADYLSKLEINGPILERSIRYAIERKRLEEDMRKAYEKVEMLVDERTEELIDARHKLIDSLDLERKRLAQEIHDGPIQDLLGITLLMLGNAATAGEEELLLNMQGAISQVVDALRDISKELRTSSLNPFNLEESIRSHAQEFQNKHPELAVSNGSVTKIDPLPERSSLAVYRIYQQAMANIGFHAKAKRVDISLTQDKENTILEVEDDGTGFIVPSCLSDLALKGHFGLVGSFERAEAVGGELQIDSRPGEGTLIRAIVPFKI